MTEREGFLFFYFDRFQLLSHYIRWKLICLRAMELMRFYLSLSKQDLNKKVHANLRRFEPVFQYLKTGKTLQAVRDTGVPRYIRTPIQGPLIP